MTVRRATLGVLLGAVLSCGTESPPADPPAALTQDLPQGVAALVGETSIPIESVGRVASGQKISAVEARDRLVHDALLANHARAAFSPSELASIERAALSRALLESIEREARAAGEPTAAELQRIVDERWLELDRPAAVRTSHAVVIAQKPEQKPAAKELAASIARAVEGVRDAEAFRKQAAAVPAGKLQVRVEQLPPVAADGRIVPVREVSGDPGRLDADFAAAAHAIDDVGGQSPVIETRFGFHVIIVEEKLPERRMPVAERPHRLREAVIAERARVRHAELLRALRTKTTVQFDRAAEALTARVRVAP